MGSHKNRLPDLIGSQGVMLSAELALDVYALPLLYHLRHFLLRQQSQCPPHPIHSAAAAEAGGLLPPDAVLLHTCSVSIIIAIID